MSSFDEKQPIGDVEAQNTNQTLSPPQPAHLNARDKADHRASVYSAGSSTLAHRDSANVADLLEKGDPITSGPPSPSADASKRPEIETEDSSPDLPPAHETPEDHAFKVHWDDDNDPENPKNWSRISRWYYTILGSLLVFNATFASSSPGGIVEKVMKEFTFSEEVAALMISLFLAGYCVGPLFWGPLSEIYGRKIPFVVSFILYTGFQVGCALSPNTGAILVFRFLGGCAASSPLANSGALMGDIWDQKTRGKAVALFTLAPFAGPAMGPVVGGFIGVSSSASWRWLFWVLTMFAGTCTVLIVFTLPETYAPVILMKKAQRRRKETGDNRWWAPLERQLAETKFVDRAKDILTKPAKMLFLEPMLLAITIYMSFVYGCLYLLFEAYPLVFEVGHGFNSGEDGLAFIPLFVGGVIGTIISVGYYNPRYVLLVKQYDPKNPPPESRLGQGVVGGAIFAVGFFWFGWTSYPGVSYWAPLISGILFGLSLMFLFLSLLNYIIDVYLFEAASALSANTILRSMAGAGFPLFATQMFKAMNPRWASTMLGLIATVMIPIPLLFIRYGPALRAKSRYSPVS